MSANQFLGWQNAFTTPAVKKSPPSEPCIHLGRSGGGIAPARRIRRGLIGISAAAVVLAVLVAGKPVYRTVKTWRAERLVATAEQQIAKGAWNDAYQSLHAANSLAPENARITRSTARLIGERGDPQALTFFETLIGSPHGSPQDRVDLIRLALRTGQLGIVQNHLIVLLGDARMAHRSDVLLLAADWHGRSGDRSRAVGFAREALAQSRDDGQTAEAKLQLARLLLQSADRTAQAPDSRQQDEAKRHLWDLAGRPDRSGLAALLSLGDACKAAASPDEATRLGELLCRHPQAGDEQRLLGLAWRLRSDPDHRKMILEEAISTFCKGGPARIAAIGRWLVQQQESRRALGLIPLATARENKDLFLIYVDALADLGRWQDLQVLLAGKVPLPIDPTIRKIYELRTSLALGRNDEAQQHWAEVHQSMRKAEPEIIFYVAQYAERLGRLDEAAKALRLLTGISGSERTGYLGLIRLTEQSGDTRKLRDQLKEFAGRFPNEFEPQNDLAYLDLLLNENVKPALEGSAQRVKRFPEILAYRTTLALAYLRSGNASAARKVYGEIETDWSTAKPGWHAVYAAVLAASGEQALAGTHASQIDAARLKPEERALIAGLGLLSTRLKLPVPRPSAHRTWLPKAGRSPRRQCQ